MIRIALLDDEKDQREVTAALLERYLSQHPELSAQVRPFQSGYELLDAMCGLATAPPDFKPNLPEDEYYRYNPGTR